ncbi:MAG: STAS domain-containing protein [Deltaproteobacteria bacterium]|nr:STAS domain-containing protein [Deltaproteobacteria bacterium]
MNIKIDAVGNVAVVRCGGSLDAESVGIFKKAMTELVNGGSTQLVVDCEKLSFIDSMGLGALISLLRRVRNQNGDLKVAGLSDDVKTIFEITRLHRLFDVCQDTNAACRQFKK